MKKIDLGEQHKILLEILLKVDDYCKRNSLRYSLNSGTLLGAIRHKGFIPWDDDIDIMMPRCDYEFFKKHFNGNYSNLECFNEIINDDCVVEFAWLKVQDNRTLMIESGMSHFLYGINIDVFPIDGMPDDYRQCEVFIKKADRLIDLLQFSTRKRLKKMDLKRVVKFILSHFLGTQKIKRMLHRHITRFDFESSTFAGKIPAGSGMKNRFSKKLFENYVDVEFEGQKFKSISDFGVYLNQVYGDYMILPPESERVSHNSIAFWKR